MLVGRQCRHCGRERPGWPPELHARTQGRRACDVEQAMQRRASMLSGALVSSGSALRLRPYQGLGSLLGEITATPAALERRLCEPVGCLPTGARAALRTMSCAAVVAAASAWVRVRRDVVQDLLAEKVVLQVAGNIQVRWDKDDRTLASSVSAGATNARN